MGRIAYLAHQIEIADRSTPKLSDWEIRKIHRALVTASTLPLHPTVDQWAACTVQAETALNYLMFSIIPLKMAVEVLAEPEQESSNDDDAQA